MYTSADSVFQIAAHEEIVPLERLYEMCRIAREILKGDHAVSRVIARPFIGTPGNFKRTYNRRDFSLKPPQETLLDKVKKAGMDVYTIHSREYVPVLVAGERIKKGINLGILSTYADIGQTVADLLGCERLPNGVSFKDEIMILR